MNRESAPFDLRGKRIWVAGHNGLVGSAIVRQLEGEDCEILKAPRCELDLEIQQAVDDYISTQRPDVIILAAAKVGGIMANNDYPADFLFQNLQIQNNVIGAAHRHGVRKLTFLGSSCIYPKLAPQPIAESELLTGPIEPTNEWYAVAKIAGIKLCQAFRRQYGDDFISCMPCNLYGPGDNFDLSSSHVLPALLAKAHQVKMAGEQDLAIWGSGSPRREFLHVQDCAEAIIFLTKNYSEAEHINIGSGHEVSIFELAEIIMEVTGLKGRIIPDPAKPDGTPRKVVNSSRLRAMNWEPSISLREGIRTTYEWYVSNYA